MNRLVLAMVAAAVVALSLIAAAGARGPSNSFAVGSGKTDALAGSQHLSFSAHTTSGFCEATGHVNYTSPTVNFSADVTRLAFGPGVNGGAAAYFSGPVTKIDNPFVGSIGDTAQFDVTDSGMPGGTGDLILFEGVFPTNVDCFAPFDFGDPVTSGNIVVKTDPLVP